MSKPWLPIAQVDVFTSGPYAGNPAGVCLIGNDADDAWMANVAREIGCSNTAFVKSRPGDEGFDLRWLTRGGVEVSLCGHATLATAHLLYEQGRLDVASCAKFYTQSGTIAARRLPNGAIEMDLPIELAVPVEQQPIQLAIALGAELVWVGRNRLDYVVEVDCETTLRSLKPKLDQLSEIETRGIIVTSRADDPRGAGYDYVLRFFGPRVGVPEDSVTGTAHCALAPYWRERLGGLQHHFTAYQASERGGLVGVRLDYDRVVISGNSVTVIRGEVLG